jgi:hypothetical protein
MAAASKRQLHFVRDSVCIPARQLYCVVLHPTGDVIGASTHEGEADDMAESINAALDTFDALARITKAEVITADKILTAERKREKQAKARKYRETEARLITDDDDDEAPQGRWKAGSI